jgi:hypothetical protein
MENNSIHAILKAHRLKKLEKPSITDEEIAEIINQREVVDFTVINHHKRKPKKEENQIDFGFLKDGVIR